MKSAYSILVLTLFCLLTACHAVRTPCEMRRDAFFNPAAGVMINGKVYTNIEVKKAPCMFDSRQTNTPHDYCPLWLWRVRVPELDITLDFSARTDSQTRLWQLDDISDPQKVLRSLGFVDFQPVSLSGDSFHAAGARGNADTAWVLTPGRAQAWSFDTLFLTSRGGENSVYALETNARAQCLTCDAAAERVTLSPDEWRFTADESARYPQCRVIVVGGNAHRIPDWQDGAAAYRPFFDCKRFCASDTPCFLYRFIGNDPSLNWHDFSVDTHPAAFLAEHELLRMDRVSARYSDRIEIEREGKTTRFLHNGSEILYAAPDSSILAYLLLLTRTNKRVYVHRDTRGELGVWAWPDAAIPALNLYKNGVFVQHIRRAQVLMLKSDPDALYTLEPDSE